MSLIRLKSPDEDWALSNPYWIVILSNGQVVYQNYEIEQQERTSWPDLKKYVQENGLRIKRVIFKFRSNEIHFEINSNAKWLFFSHGAGKELNILTDGSPAPTDEFFVLGIQSTDTVIKKFWYKKPELTLFMTEAEIISQIKPKFLLRMPLEESANLDKITHG